MAKTDHLPTHVNGYLLGTAAGLVGNSLFGTLTLGPAMTGMCSLLAAGWLLVRRRKKHCHLSAQVTALPLVAMGLAMSLTPCVPLATLLAVAAMTASPWNGALTGLLFGCGAFVTPLLAIIPLVSMAGNRLVTHAHIGHWLGVVLLTVSGIQQLTSK